MGELERHTGRRDASRRKRCRIACAVIKIRCIMVHVNEHMMQITVTTSDSKGRKKKEIATVRNPTGRQKWEYTVLKKRETGFV
ncbi:hypothetical protein HYDPIDRAFT_118530 [Hydnomerulius pinastri MD-312]|uniref:Uncharacterized protein n=1 Tax=Hydnomerulius pinastri MD-312 TaxID=994086 RepID=A0A0C9VP26_9AGAM|nr:hypothetical protein HYDPIDRAFT_118530 [Hydnomerulius pinastri MD-312]